MKSSCKEGAMKKKGIITSLIGLVILVALVGGLIWAFSSELVQVTVGKPKEGVNRPSPVICTDSMVADYNAAALITQRTGKDRPSADDQAKKTIAERVKALSGNENDPTCQAILFSAAYEASDKEAVNKAFGRIKALHAAGIFVNNNFRGAMPLDEYEVMVKLVEAKGQAINPKGTN